MARYREGLESGLYRADPRQLRTVLMLQELYDDLQKAGVDHSLPGQHHHRPRRRPSGLTIVDTISSGSDYGGGSTTTGGGWLTGLFGGSSSGRGEAPLGRGAASAADSPPAVRGLYMYGGVGCGKTMLMDLFVSTAPSHFKVLRTHFHDFMLEVHAALRRYARAPDPLSAVADAIVDGTAGAGSAHHHPAGVRVLALDELFVTDVADAMILNRLFGRLWERGLVLVATSNRPPDDLYKGGLQRNLFMPFIHRLKTQCRAHDMASGTDYRRLAQHQRGLYFVTALAKPGSASAPCAASSRAFGAPSAAAMAAAAAADPFAEDTPVITDPLTERFTELAGSDATPAPVTVEVAMGRTLQVPLAAGKACIFDFADLCGRPVAAADYLALTSRFHTLALRGVPVFGAANRTEAYRFVALIDVMYDARTRLLVTAEAGPVDLFTNILTQHDAAKRPEAAAKPEAVVDDNLGFAKDRTISRLIEMQSLEYLIHHAKQYEPSLLLALKEARSKARDAASAAGH
ncbi:hypothetical protein HYH03_007997 [Edaphochlamys debaryana]|uniref:AFG1-like ATPase n=1 Tax=Edaphochlamys debaryana TaxID=47281 RepID=A0A835Y228_9CHLO|nr:hypothetical protein HYH03_007997 [Edaphochlamys debaryana]|eukprot:KAG2493777.1 hypothetical protein HYH03_007997 [Edaphochlamys debaryana]